MEHFANQIAAVVKCWYIEFVVRDRTSMCFVITATPDMEDQIYDCLQTSMVAVQGKEDMRASFRFVSDPNGHHQYSGWVLWPRIVMVLPPLTSQPSS